MTYKIDINTEDLMNIQTGLVAKIFQLDELIIRNKAQGYPTDVYEASKEDLLNTYEKVSTLKTKSEVGEIDQTQGLRNFSKEIEAHEKAIKSIKEDQEKLYQEKVENVKKEISVLRSSDFLVIVEEETTRRRRKRDEIRGGNDIEINKINMVLKDEFWCTKAYLLFENGTYFTMTQNKEEVDRFLNNGENRTFKEEIVDLRGIY